jgi:hypothetical protein
MKKASGFIVLMCLGVLMLSQFVMAQSVKVPIHVTDNVGAVNITIGFDPAATNHIDSALGEEEQPVEPPDKAFDARSITILSGLGKDTCLLGLLKNFHKGVAAAQADRWRISFKSDSSGDSVTLSWPAHLSDSAGGKWTLQDGSGSNLFPDVDMTTQTSFTYPAKSFTDQYVFIKTQDKSTYRTFKQEEIALAVNSKGKVSTAEKRKPYASFGQFKFDNPNNPPESAVALHVEFDQAVIPAPGGVDEVPQSYGPFTVANSTDAAGKKKKWDFSAPAGPVGASVNISTYGNKGKLPAAKKYWWLDGTNTIIGGKLGPATLTSSQLLLQMPNINNVGEELYAQGAFPELDAKGKPVGIRLGIPTQAGIDAKLKPFFKEVTHPKWKDATKTLYSKKAAGFVSTGAPRCLDIFDNSTKAILKVQKSLPPDKHNNKLVAEALALKFSIAASLFNKTAPGLGQFTYVGGRYNGLTLQHIAELCDTALSCQPNSVVGSDPDSMLQLYNVVRSIDSAFSGPFDTLSFGTKTVLSGVRSASDVSFLHKGPEATPLVIIRPFVDPNPIPGTFTLRQNYPNPFNPTTTIEFALPSDAIVSLKIYNILGQEIATLVDHELLDAGSQSFDFDASRLTSGVYFYRVVGQAVDDDGVATSDYYTSVKKMMLLK